LQLERVGEVIAEPGLKLARFCSRLWMVVPALYALNSASLGSAAVSKASAAKTSSST
jgi:hypothetical protein